jgi:hypothetical protein
MVQQQRQPDAGSAVSMTLVAEASRRVYFHVSRILSDRERLATKRQIKRRLIQRLIKRRLMRKKLATKRFDSRDIPSGRSTAVRRLATRILIRRRLASRSLVRGSSTAISVMPPQRVTSLEFKT